MAHAGDQARHQQRIDTVRSKIVSASIYPVILLMVGGGVSAFLIGYVVPKFAEVYHGAGRDLPWMSQLLLDWGQFAAGHGSAILVAQAVGARALDRAGRLARQSLLWSVLLAVPLALVGLGLADLIIGVRESPAPRSTPPPRIKATSTTTVPIVTRK